MPNSTTFFNSAVLPDGPNLLFNYSLAASVATNALTIALKDKSGNDPGPGNPVLIPFRSATATTGTYSVLSVSTPLSITVPDATGLGLTVSVASSLYIYALNNTGTVELVVSPSNYWEEGFLQTTVAVSGGASILSLYSTTSRGSVPITKLGRIEITLAASTHWSNAPTYISSQAFRTGRQFIPGTPQTSNGTTTSTTYAAPSNPPTVAITPQRTATYKIFGSFNIGPAGANVVAAIEVVAIVGSPTVLVNQDQVLLPGSNAIAGASPFILVRLVAGTSYTFTVAMLTGNGANAATLYSANNILGSYLVAEEL